MLINITQSRLVIGRFTILPGDKVPAFALTDAETKAVQDFADRGFLAEKEIPKPQPAPKKGRDAGKGMAKTEQKAEMPSSSGEMTSADLGSSGENKGE